jgi:hypothetical protein
MRRRIGLMVAVLAIVGMASGCSLREVQLWFAFNRHEVISRDQAKGLADIVNSKRAARGCDGNYASGCVPDNATQVHCAGAPGDGPAVSGPLTISGWDSFELDPDGDKNVCDSPVGSFDMFNQQLGSIIVRGWAFDPNTTEPINLAVSVNGYVVNVPADQPRGDLAAALPGVGTNHGFDVDLDAGGVSDTTAICVVALNVGTGTNTTLACKTIVTIDVGYDDSAGADVYGMIETADTVGPNLHLRGFAFGIGVTPQFTVGIVDRIDITSAIVYGRDDIEAAEPAAPAAVGFDLTIPLPLEARILGSVCLSYAVPPTTPQTMLSCRQVDT